MRFTLTEKRASLLMAALAYQREDTERAEALLISTVGRFEREQMRLFVESARRRLGELAGGHRGRQMITAADEWMKNKTFKIRS